MADYRAYTIGPDGHFIGVEMLSIPGDDAAAIEAARRLVGEHDVELWDRDRLVGRLKGKSRPRKGATRTGTCNGVTNLFPGGNNAQVSY
jgi:hypothetical protein